MNILLWMHLIIAEIFFQTYGKGIDSTMQAGTELAGAHLVEQDFLEFPEESKKKRAAARNEGKWPSPSFFYLFESGQGQLSFTRAEVINTRQAIAEWSRYTCIRLYEAASAADSVRKILRIKKTTSLCGATVGYNPDGNYIYMASDCFERGKANILRQLGHSLGLLSENNRPDRDNYVDILWANITSENKLNFVKVTESYVNPRIRMPYDYLSIMHFNQYEGGYTCHLRPCQTIRTKRTGYQYVIGNTGALSFLDIKSINLLYNCNAHCSATQRAQNCPGDGYVGNDCKCWCPGNINDMLCPDDDECADKSHNCSVNAACINLYGTYDCQCNAGFFGDGRTCFDDDECADKSHNCSVNAACINLYGTYDCHCYTGFFGDGRTCLEYQGLFYDWSINPNCTETGNSYGCWCKPGLVDDEKTCFKLDEDELGFTLNEYKYRKISADTTQSWSYFNNQCESLGARWSPVEFRKRRDYLTFGEVHGYLVDLRSFWLKGSTDRPNKKSVKFAQYRNDSSGSRCVFFNTFRRGVYQSDFFNIEAWDCEDDNKVDAIMCQLKQGNISIPLP